MRVTMEVTSVTKSSDEIINELFTSLNVPLSPPLQTLDENVNITREALHSDTSNDHKEEGHSEDSLTSGNETRSADRGRVKKSREKNASETDTKHKKKKKKRKKSHKKDDDYHKHKHKRKSKSKKKGDKEKSSTTLNETVCEDSLRDILDNIEIKISEDCTQKDKNSCTQKDKNSSIEKCSITEVKSLLQKDKNSSDDKDRSKSRDRDRESSSKRNSSRHDLSWKKSTSTVNKRKRSRSPSPRVKTRTKESVSRSSSRSRKRSRHSRSPVSESKQQKGWSWPSDSLSKSPRSRKQLCSHSPTQEVRKEKEDEKTCAIATPKHLSEGEEGEGQESIMGKVCLDSIPLPLPAPLDIDPSSIPLPDTISQPCLINKVEPLKTECENVVVSSSVENSNEKQSLETREDDTKKVKEEVGTDKNKSKVIVIKSLKDSIVFQLAQEEAERRAKERPPSSGEEENWEPNASLDEELEKLTSAIYKVREEGEIVSSDEPEEQVKQESEESKKLNKEEKKKREKSKEKKNSKKKSSKKSKEKDKKKHKKEKDKKRKKKSRSGSRSGSRSRGRGRSKSEDAYYSKYRKRYSRSRSNSPYSRSRSPYDRSRSRERKRNSHNDLRDKNARKRLLDIARRNAVYLVRHGCLPPSVEQEQLVKIQAGGKSVEELTDFCRQLVADGHYDELTDILSTEEEEKDEQAFSSSARHPFSIKDKPILMNIRNAPMLPTKTNKERLADNAMLRQQFPVSSGSQHRSKESGWIPVTPKGKKAAAAAGGDEDQVFPVGANKTQIGKQAPGMFTGTTGAKIMTQEELSAGYQAWAKKGQFNKAAPVSSRFGLKMLRKMGWKPGQGLGKNREGHLEPLKIDVKVDKRGFHAQEELTPKRAPIPMAKDLSGKHPVSALVELCCKRKWAPPDFEMVFDCGPDHKKNFLMKVKINGHEYKSSIAASTKKLAKAHAAAACLQSLGPQAWEVKEDNKVENNKEEKKPKKTA